MDRLHTEKEKFTEKNDLRLAATETKLEAATSAYEDLNAELKRDIPLLLAKAESFFQPLILLMVINQGNFWAGMSQFTTALSQRIDTSKAIVPEIQQIITPKAQSAVNRKYSTITANPWEKGPQNPALTYGGASPTPALPAPSPYNNPPPAIHHNPPPVQPHPGYVPPVQPHPGHVPPVQPHPGYVPPVQPHPGHLPPTPNRFPSQVPQSNPLPQPRVSNVHTTPQPYVPQPGNPFAQPAAAHSPVPTPVPIPTPSNPFAGGGRPLPPQKTQAKALWDFNAEAPTELTFKAGDIITIHAKEGEWWTGELRGKTGSIPANYVQLC
jgi:hypothetical protein